VFCARFCHHWAKTHTVETYIDIDSIIDNAIMNEEAELIDDNENPAGSAEGNNNVLAYIAEQQSSSGDIRQVLAAKRAPDKQKKQKSTKVYPPHPPSP
jgi:hypothetical protein